MSITLPTPGAIVLHRLPVQARMLVRVMGEAPAYRLMQARGGVPFTVPKHLHSDEGARLMDLCGGADGAARLVAECAGETLQLPKYDAVLRQLRHRRVVEMRQHGARLADIALALGYTVRQVINILNAAGLAGEGLDGDNADIASRQTDLFAELDELPD